ncbi:hypothetical protein SH528x_000055 [Novipirellula sp. SH528]|uniref:hypothetical protein n=1 Tax=Novipirellula sp. SH528 TaxID=3454466 RepID=UPI003FA19283
MMKRFALLSVSCAMVLFLGNSFVHAQPPGGRQGGGGRGGQAGGAVRGQQGGAQQTPPLIRIFDADNDGELSAAEIDAAAVVLRKLDQNRDGRLTAEELRPSGPGGPGGPGGERGPGGRQGGPGQQGPGARGQGGPDGGGGGRGGDSAQSDEAFANQVLAFDANKDGLLSQAELPEHMHHAFALADADKNGTLDQAERLVLASQFRRNKLQPGSENLEMKNRPTQGRRGGGGN